MKVLVFDEWFPWPLESGKKIRSYNLLKLLSKKHDIIYLGFAKSPDDDIKIEEISKWCYRVIPVTDLRKTKWTPLFYLDVIKNIFSDRPFSTSYHITDYFRKVLEDTIKEENPDLIHCEWSNLAPYLEYITNKPTIISSHNIESDIWKRLYTSTNNILVRYIAKHQAKRIEQLERYWYPKASCCIAVSKQDQQVIHGYGANVDVIENGVDIDYYDSFNDSNYNLNKISFTASFDTFSNQDGAYYLLNEIYPLIKQRNPDIKLILIGKNPPKSLINYAKTDSSVYVTGTVADVRPYLQDVSICVVPLRIGGGSRLKILEAMAMKRAVVSTSIGAEGLEITDNENILIADSPKEFAEKVTQLIQNKERRELLEQSGYEFVKNNYDWNILAEKHHIAWESILEKSSVSE